MTKKIAGLFLVLLILSGCGEDVSELEKKVLERDPSFQTVIDARIALSTELEETKKAYSKKKCSSEAQIYAIKKELEKSRGEYVAKMARAKKKLDPEITALKNDIKRMKLAVTVKNSELRLIEKSIKEIKELVQKGQDLEMTQEEMRMWNERMTSLLKKREDAVREKDKMIFDVKTDELKIRIITVR